MVSEDEPNYPSIGLISVPLGSARKKNDPLTCSQYSLKIYVNLESNPSPPTYLSIKLLPAKRTHASSAKPLQTSIAKKVYSCREHRYAIVPRHQKKNPEQKKRPNQPSRDLRLAILPLSQRNDFRARIGPRR